MKFIELYKIIKEGMDRIKLYGWLNPNGEMFPVQYANHAVWARDYLRGKGQHLSFSSSAYNIMFELKWLRVTYSGNELLVQNSYFRPNEKQLRELKNLAIEYNMRKIEWDNDEELKTIWTLDDHNK